MFRKAELNLGAELARYVLGAKPIDETKAHLDWLAFAIAEAARFIPVRCAVACELCGDYRFLQVIARLAKWVETAGFKEMYTKTGRKAFIRARRLAEVTWKSRDSVHES